MAGDLVGSLPIAICLCNTLEPIGPTVSREKAVKIGGVRQLVRQLP